MNKPIHAWGRRPEPRPGQEHNAAVGSVGSEGAEGGPAILSRRRLPDLPYRRQGCGPPESNMSIFYSEFSSLQDPLDHIRIAGSETFSTWKQGRICSMMLSISVGTSPDPAPSGTPMNAYLMIFIEYFYRYLGKRVRNSPYWSLLIGASVEGLEFLYEWKSKFSFLLTTLILFLYYILLLPTL